MRIKLEHLLIAIIVLIGLYLLMNRCRCNRFSVGGIEGEYDTCKEYWEEEVACDDENLIHDESKANYNLDKSDVWDYDEECCNELLPYVDLTKVIVEGDNLKYINADNTKTVLYVDPLGKSGGFGAIYRVYDKSNLNIAFILKQFENKVYGQSDSLEESEIVERIQTLKETIGYDCDTVDSRILDTKIVKNKNEQSWIEGQDCGRNGAGTQNPSNNSKK